MDFINQAWAKIGGKRGLAVLIGTVVTVGQILGYIPPEMAVKIDAVAAALGLVGIGHNALKSSEPTAP